MGSKKFQDYVDQIHDFFRRQGVKIDPLPELRLLRGSGSRFDPFVPTGNYSGETRTITLYVGRRHVKDILRSYCHELVHHSQNLSDPGKFAALDKEGALRDNPALEKIEGDCYKRGNILFRRWTESIK